MSEDKGLKSAYDLAMERLQKKDAAAGVERKAVTEAQKAEIAEVRYIYESRLAEVDVLFQSQMRAMVDPAEREAREQQYRRDRERLTSERDAKVDRIRG